MPKIPLTLSQAFLAASPISLPTFPRSNGKINLSNIDELAFVLSDLNNKGYEVILVTSGAIGVGLNVLGIDKRPKGID